MIPMIIDTETANIVAQPIPYDIGYQIFDTDTHQHLVERSFVVQETFTNKELMSSAYYAKKVPQYWKDLEAGKREMKRITSIKRIVEEDMKATGCTLVGAYNMGFDKRATNNGIRYNTYSFYRWFFPYGTEFFDLWHGACSSILRSKHYIKWALANNLISSKGNILTSAEAAYKYIIKNPDFEESHTGLEDVHIEREIFDTIQFSKMKSDFTIVGAPWRIVQKAREEFGL